MHVALKGGAGVLHIVATASPRLPDLRLADALVLFLVSLIRAVGSHSASDLDQ